MARISAALALVFVLTACSKSEQSAAPAAPMGVPEFRAALPVKELMGHAIDPTADGVWLNQGWVLDEGGTHELFPTDEAGWQAVANSAVTLAELSNALLLPGRPVDDDPKWVDSAHMLYDAAMDARAAAEAHDKEAFFNAGGEMYQACVTCHAHYVQDDLPGPAARLPALPPTPNQ